jgi:hypothetical protein
MAERRLAAPGFATLLVFALALAPLASGQQNSARAQQASGVVAFDSPASDFKIVTQEQYLAELQTLQALVASCKAKAAACDAGKADEDVTVTAGGRRFDVRQAWLRNALTDARGKSDAERGELMAKAADRLNADAQEVTSSTQPAQGTPQMLARKEADAILSRSEFGKVEQEGWLDQKWALFTLWFSALVDRFFSGLPHSSWVAPVVEWGILIAAAVALIVWAWRVTQQQRVALAVPDANRQILWQKESDDWARRAEVQAAAGDWREAVHCLYWAAIVMLEGRRAWRPNRARTPREYLPLLEAGSQRQRALNGLTRLFERIWYGLRPAARRDFEQAQALLDELKAA